MRISRSGGSLMVMTIHRTFSTVALTAVLALGVSACGSDDEARPIPTSGSIEMDESASPSPQATAPRGDDGDDVTDPELRERLEQIALDEVGDGRIDDVEYSDDSTHAYEVEVDLASGDDVTVEISEDFEVVRVDR
ncbi:hypothetical protein GCM10009821_12880 [Aeromicrobium halocynthiae]|uniref:PepSY domain-containing protein n=1 Tax=Aeromicrobium halocynthiae TaxID=560557 RepID=A0ABP5HJ27_9ACTN